MCVWRTYVQTYVFFNFADRFIIKLLLFEEMYRNELQFFHSYGMHVIQFYLFEYNIRHALWN